MIECDGFLFNDEQDLETHGQFISENHRKEIARWLAKQKEEKKNVVIKKHTKIPENNMVQEVSLEEFRNTGLPAFINQILHIFGYSIIFDIDEKTKEATSMKPARVKFRGMSEDVVTRNYCKLASYLKDNADELYNEAGYDK